MHAGRHKSARHHRAYRLRFKIRGTADRPRLSVFRSTRHMYAQVIDDERGHTLAAASTQDPELASFTGGKTAAATKVGELVVQRALAAGVRSLVFDRNGFYFTGRVAAVSKAAHKSGLLGGAALSDEQAAKSIAFLEGKQAGPQAEPVEAADQGKETE